MKQENEQGASCAAPPRQSTRQMFKRLFLVILASVVMSANIQSFVDAGGLFPGGFTGLTLLIQRSAQEFAGIALPFTIINFALNAVPAVISFKLIGKRFTLYSCLAIVLTSILTDLIPPIQITNDVLLVCIFGGIFNGLSISLCLLGGATSGGTDFISVALSERLGVDAWNYIFFGNCVMLAVAGLLFGWDKALYSIISSLRPRKSCTCSTCASSTRRCSSSPTVQWRFTKRSKTPPITVRRCSAEPACITARNAI